MKGRPAKVNQQEAGHASIETLQLRYRLIY
jgi:hypothetical protein